MVLLGVVLLGLGIQLFIDSRKFVASGTKTEAIVMENIATESRNDNGASTILYAPLLQYEVRGKAQTYVPNARSNPPAYDIGEKVPIIYSAKNARNVRIVSYWGIYLGSNILIALGLPLLVTGAGYFLFKWGII